MLNKVIRKARRAHRNSYRVKMTNLVNRGLPRVLVNRTERNIFAQLIDVQGKTHVIFGSNQKVFKNRANKEQKSYNINGAFLIGQMMGEFLVQNNHKEFVFDRSSFQFHGRIKAVSNGIYSILNGENK